MEVGADKRSLIKLGAALAVLAAVLYFQFFRTSVPQPAAPRIAPDAPTTARNSEAELPPTRQPRGGRFQPRLGRREADEALDPLTAETNLRTDLLHKVRAIEVPTVDRDIFNFGRPKPPPPQPPDPEAAREAQRRVEEQMRAQRERASRQKPAPPPAPRARPPSWKYFGVASREDTVAQRAFLLDGEEILVAERGLVLQDRYRIESIGLEALVLADLKSKQEFSIPLEMPR